MHPYYAANAAEYPLHEAAARGTPEQVRQVLAEGADIAKIGIFKETALHWVAARGEKELARDMVRAGAYCGAVNRFGETPAMVARKHRHPALAEWLDVTNGLQDSKEIPFKDTPVDFKNTPIDHNRDNDRDRGPGR